MFSQEQIECGTATEVESQVVFFFSSKTFLANKVVDLTKKS